MLTLKELIPALQMEQAVAARSQERQMKTVRGYIHHDGSVAVLVRFVVGSDFTALTEEFRDFSASVAMALAFRYREDKDGRPMRTIPPPDAEDSAWVCGGYGDAKTVGEALAAASKLFHEPVAIDAISLMFDDIDRRDPISLKK